MSDKNTNETSVNKSMLLVCCIILALVAVLTVVMICRNFYTNDSALTGDESTLETTDTEPVTSEDTTTVEDTTEPEETTAEDTTRAPITDIGDETTDFTPPTNGKYTYISLENEKLKYPGTVIQAGRDAGEDYLNKLVYIGDSLTHGLEYYKILPEENVWTPLSGTMTLSNVAGKKIYFTEDKKEIPITDALARTKPEILVIALGVNGISWLNEENFKNEFRSLVSTVKKITPETKIILQSIFPVAPSWKQQESINNFKISRANKWMLEVAYELGLYYMDVAECLVDAETGYLPETSDSGDGLHLNAQTYRVVANYIRTHSIPTKPSSTKPVDTTEATTAPQPEAPDTTEETTADTTVDIIENTTEDTTAEIIE